MDIEEIIQVICKTYYPLSEECQLELAKNSRVLLLEKDTPLVKEGQYSDKTFFIVKGCARAFYLRDGKDISDWFAFENNFISSINSFFLDVPSPHSIEVLEPSVFLEISRETINGLSEKFMDFERLTKQVVTQTMLKLQARVTSMQFQTAEQKYNDLLLVHPDITQRIALTHIASYIGITLETLSRIRHNKSRI